MLLTSSLFEKTYSLHHSLIAKISKLRIFIFHFSRSSYRSTEIILHYINLKYLSQLFFFFTHHQIIFLLLLNFISYLFLLIYNSELLYQHIYSLLSSFNLSSDLVFIFDNILFLSSLC